MGNELAPGKTTTMTFGSYSYEITKLNDNVGVQRNNKTAKVRKIRRMKREERIEQDAQPKTPEPEFVIDDEENYKDKIVAAKSVFDGAIFDADVYSLVANSDEHILQTFGPSNILQPSDICMFLSSSMNRLLRHSSDSTPLPPLNHAIYYAKKKRRKEINEEIERLKKSRSPNEDKSVEKAKDVDKDSSDSDKKKKKLAKEWSDKFFKIFDVAHNGDLDFNEFKKGCQTINIQWKALFAEVLKKREDE